MKRISIYIGLIVAIIIGLSSCYKDIIIPELGTGPDDLPPKQVSFQNELIPLFASNCALAGCHVTGAHTPYLTSTVAFTQIINGNFVKLSDPIKSILYEKITGEMAQYMPSPAKANAQKIYDWIRNGAPNN